MVLIFGFSSQSGEESSNLSSLIAAPVTEVIVSMQEEPPPVHEVRVLYSQVSHFVRKTAHFSEYALLGLLWALLMQSYGWTAFYLPWSIGTIYAVTDEVHQLFTPDRAGQISDVLLDSVGVLCGVLIVRLINKIWRRYHADHS